MRMRAIIMRLSLKLWLCVRFRTQCHSEEASFTPLLPPLGLFVSSHLPPPSPHALSPVPLSSPQDQSNTEILIGVMSAGIVVYKNRVRINYFPWWVTHTSRTEDHRHHCVCGLGFCTFLCPLKYNKAKWETHVKSRSDRGSVMTGFTWVFLKARFQRELWGIPEDDYPLGCSPEFCVTSRVFFFPCLPFQW